MTVPHSSHFASKQHHATLGTPDAFALRSILKTLTLYVQEIIIRNCPPKKITILKSFSFKNFRDF